MRKIYYLALIALVTIAFSSCQMGGKSSEPAFYLQDLQGLWQNDQYETWHLRFTEDAADEENFFWGCEWGDFGDDVKEENLVYHGNGWFKYRLNEDELLEIHKMDEGWADIPKVYIISILTADELEYYEKEFKSTKYHFSKVLPMDTYPE